MLVKKAVIAAAGWGTRFLPVTKVYPKELIPVGGKPVIQFLAEELLGAGVKEVLIIHRHGDSLLRQYFSPNEVLEKFLEKNGKKSWLADWEKVAKGLKIVFRPQPRSLPYGTGSPVLTAKNFIAGEPFIYMYGDDLVLEKKPGKFLKSMAGDFFKYKTLGVMGVQRVDWEEVERYGSVRFLKGSKIPGQIETVEERLPKEKAPSNCVQFGRFVLSGEIFEMLNLQKIRLGELLFTDAMKALAKKGVVTAKAIEKGEWLTTGDPERWLATNIRFQKFFLKNSGSRG